jgi:hypothetical protein
MASARHLTLAQMDTAVAKVPMLCTSRGSVMLFEMEITSDPSFGVLPPTGSFLPHLCKGDMTDKSSSGATPAITEPSGRAQRDTILQAYAQAGIDNFSETGYFECHGTGTPVGDCIELGAVGEVFSASHNSGDALWVGSVSCDPVHYFFLGSFPYSKLTGE